MNMTIYKNGKKVGVLLSNEPHLTQDLETLRDLHQYVESTGDQTGIPVQVSIRRRGEYEFCYKTAKWLLSDKNFKRPRHFMTTMAVVGQKSPCAVLVFGKDGRKCHTIHGDILIGDLYLPTQNELIFIHNASKMMALTEEDKLILAQPDNENKEQK